MSYTKQRYITFGLITLFVLVLPFITINGNHMLLLSFEKLQFHFLGFIFNVNELTIMPFLLMFFFIGILAVTSIFGRAWCGWACPQTIFRVIYRDLIEGTLLDLRKRRDKQKEVKDKFGVLVAMALWAILSFIIASNLLWYFVPPEDFFLYMQDPFEHNILSLTVLFFAGAVFYNIVFFKENFCVYLCPYSRIQNSLYNEDTKQVIYDFNRGGKIYDSSEQIVFSTQDLKVNDDCIACNACVKVCPANIDIRKGSQYECINCLECIDSCDTVMGKLGKESLIEWGSINKVLKRKEVGFFSKKNIIFIVGLILSLVLAIWMGSKKEDVLINVNRDTQLYKIKSPERVINNYVFTIQNTQGEDYIFDIKLLDSDFEIKRVRPFLVKSNKRVKKIISIETTKNLDLNNKTDAHLKIKAVVFAKDKPEINAKYDVPFIYPSKDLLK